MKMITDIIIHRWLRVPYGLNTHVRRAVKKPRAYVLFIHGIGTSSAAWKKVIDRLPDDIQVTSVDLLGFGLSPRPAWAIYDAKRQARSVVLTYLKLRLRGRVIIVGHSLGALVAVEIAKLYPRFVKSLILCSPPFYAPQQSKTLLPSTEKILHELYRAIQSRPDQFVKISRAAAKYGLVNRGFQVTEDNVDSYMNALEASILNQTAFDDVRSLTLPIKIFYGTLDPVVIKKHLRKLDRDMTNVTFKSLVAGHEVKGLYVTAVANAVTEVIEAKSLTSSRR